MSLDVYLEAMRPSLIYSGNVTHNLVLMAKEADIYDCLWRPDENGISKAGQLIPLLRDGLERLEADPERFNKLNPENGWGSYDGLIKFVKDYLAACEESPDADVRVWR